ncbi:hypothetical protein ABOONEI_2248 [Aciduliprofundum boonei T469]|nr:hypothetical protein ABOONEI_2248 [Aciduliprofundum boonei T469]
MIRIYGFIHLSCYSELAEYGCFIKLVHSFIIYGFMRIIGFFIYKFIHMDICLMFCGYAKFGVSQIWVYQGVATHPPVK